MTRTRIGKYVDIQTLGMGGMAEVYIGKDPTLDRKVAIKFILPHLTSDENFETRFEREAKTIAALRHPNIIQVYEYAIEDHSPYMVMEYLEGGTLADLIEDHKNKGETIPFERTAIILEKLANALDFAHSQDVIHRDIKPSNILMSVHGEPILADFGIAKMLNESVVLTQSGSFVGSPRYLPPEQASNMPIDKRSDMYSLGIVIYEMVAGRTPFEGDLVQVMMQHVGQEPPLPREFNPDLPYAAENAILKAIAKNPDERYETVGDFARVFKESIFGPSIIASQTASQAAQAPPPPSPALTAEIATKESLPETLESQPAPQKKRSFPVWLMAVIGVAVFAAAALAFSGVFNQPADEQAASQPPAATEAVQEATNTPPAAQETTVEEQPVEETPIVVIDTTTPVGFVSIQGSDLTISLTELAPLGEDQIYAVWLTEPGTPEFFIGTIGEQGGELSFSDPAGADLLRAFSGFAITREPASVDPPGFSDLVVYQAQTDETILQDYRHLTDTLNLPLAQAMRNNMLTQANRFDDHSGFSLADLNNNSLGGAKNHAEHTINIAVGVGSPDYFDWDNDGRPENPGDDVGLLPYLRVFANAVSLTDPAAGEQAAELINQLETHVSLFQKITASDTSEEAVAHAQQLNAEQGQILTSLQALLAGTTQEYSLHFEFFPTGN